ncbi:MAG: hypothetical protein RR673_07150, partial [Erysipelotrichaceae bacterium]
GDGNIPINDFITHVFNLTDDMILSYEVVKDNGIIHHYITLQIKPCFCPNCSSSKLYIKEYRTRIIKHAALRNIPEIIHYQARR